jgi:exopolysaccharide biosynthesis polyprenyl glycosylphosphotransferase
MRPTRIQISSRQVLVFAVDLLLLFVGILVAWALRQLDPQWIRRPGFILEIRTGATTLTLLVYLLTFYVFELYNPVINFLRAAGIARILAAVAVAAALLVFFFYIVPFWRESRGIMLIHAGFVALTVTAWRMIATKWWLRKVGNTPALLVGAGRVGALAMEAIRARPDRGIHVVGVLDDDEQKRAAGTFEGVSFLGGTEALQQVVRDHHVELLVVAFKQPRDPAFARTLLDLKSHAVRVIHAATLYKYLTGRVPILYVDDFYFLFGPDLERLRSPVLRNLQRLFDVGVSALGLLLSGPLLLLGMLAVKLTSKGPVFYRQQRVGLDKRPFDILKLRTMRTDAEARTGAVMSQPGRDPRVTPVGRFLRRSRVDELPQLLNVLRGDMSFIGPRPERPEFTQRFEKEIPYYGLRFAVKPGLTGWAQVNYRYGSDAADTAVKLQYDLYYIQEMSVLMDIHILIKTAQTVLFRGGS